MLSWGLIPLGVLWLVSGVVHGIHFHNGALNSVPSFWLAMFYVGGPIVLFIAGMLITIRRRERTRFAPVDRVSLWIATVGVVVFAGTLALMLLEIQRLKHPSRNPVTNTHEKYDR